MRIDLHSGAAASGSSFEKTSPSHAAQTTTQSAPSPVSESDTRVGKLAAEALSSPEVRSQKVQELQVQVQSGKYQVSATQMAASIFEQMRRV